VRARCVSARRAALTRALDMLPRAAKSGRPDAGGALVRIFGCGERECENTNYKQPD
jgi:hypothetical protein